jgi:rhamnosyl/mannosyltransferase
MAVNSDILCKFADKTIVCSYFIENRPLSSVPVIDTSKFGRYMLGVGRLVPYKGFEYIIQAMPSIDDLNLVICGNGFLYEKLIALSEELKLTGRINIITDASDEYLAELYAGCEFFVFPSCLPSEAFGIAMLDAMNNGKAILNTCLNTGVNYVARDGLEALTVAPCCVMELVAAVKKLAFDVEFRQELGNNAQQRSNTVFSKENRRVTLLKIFSEVLRSKNV